MIEIFTDIRDEVKTKAEIIWRAAVAQSNPMKAAKFLNQITKYYSERWTDEENDFLQFYIQLQMEMRKR